jgi:hypothetical protein
MLSVLVDAEPAIVNGVALPDAWESDVKMGEN